MRILIRSRSESVRHAIWDKEPVTRTESSPIIQYAAAHYYSKASAGIID